MRTAGTVGNLTVLENCTLAPIWVRKTEPRPLRIFQQETTDDNDRLWGNWPQGNAQMAEALVFSHYDAHFIVGPGIHDFDHATEVMPEALRWLWRDYPEPIIAATTGSICFRMSAPTPLEAAAWAATCRLTSLLPSTWPRMPLPSAAVEGCASEPRSSR